MDMEDLIRQITDSVLAKLNETQGYDPGERTAVFSERRGEDPVRIYDLTRMEANLTLEEARNAVTLASSRGYRSICLPQWLVAPASEIARGNTLLATIVGLPGGKAMTQAKYAETKIAIQNGVDVLVIPMNMDMIAEGKRDEARLDLMNASIPADGTNSIVIAMVEIGDVPEDRIFDAIAIAESAKADEVRLSCIVSGKAAEPEMIGRFIRKSGLPVSVVGGISEDMFNSITACGVCGIGASFER